MKKILLTVTAFLSFQLAMAQAPQGLNYQAVVFSSNGTALSNQLVSLRLSVLDSSATGTAVYVETQTPTTDTTGLFSVVIGNGTVVSGTFSTINWGKNYKFLKTEIDTLGGSNYITMGVTQFMSVPYALYTNPTYASIDYPDGMRNITPVMIGTAPYTVPAGKNLYVIRHNYSTLVTNNDTLESGSVFPQGFSSNQTVHFINDTFPCWLTNKTVDWITADIVTTPITVPIGKLLIIESSNSGPSGFPGLTHLFIYVDGIDLNNTPGWFPLSGLTLESGQVLSAVPIGGTGQFIVNGYFRDE